MERDVKIIINQKKYTIYLRLIFKYAEVDFKTKFLQTVLKYDNRMKKFEQEFPDVSR